MKIQVLSDIHREFGTPDLDFHPDSDVIAIAGDISVSGEVERALNNLELPQKKKVLAVRGNHDCLDIETECLTREGWKKHKDLSVNDIVLTINEELGFIEWNQVQEKIYSVKNKIYEFSNSSVDISVSKFHRNLTIGRYNKKFQYFNIDNIPKSRHIFINSFYNNNEDYSIADNELKLLGWILTDGSYTKDGFFIYQSKKDGIEEIRNILNSLSYQYSFSIRNREIKEICGKTLKKPPLPSGTFKIKIPSGSKIHDFIYLKKEINKENFLSLSNRQIKLCLISMMDGDGSWTKKTMKSGALNGKKEFLDFIQILCCISGIRAHLVEYRPGDFRLNISFDFFGTSTDKLKFSEKEYNDLTWCIQVKNHNFLIRRNGKTCFTGNCWINPQYHSFPAPLDKNITILDCQIKTIKKQRFLGCSLWYDPDKTQGNWSDFVYYDREKISQHHQKEVAFLYDNLQENDVVITHFLPSHTCTHPRWKNYDSNCFFVGEELQELIIERKPKLWIFGHTHDSMDFYLGQTRMVCNPYGYYPGGLNPNYETKVIDI